MEREGEREEERVRQMSCYTKKKGGGAQRKEEKKRGKGAQRYEEQPDRITLTVSWTFGRKQHSYQAQSCITCYATCGGRGATQHPPLVPIMQWLILFTSESSPFVSVLPGKDIAWCDSGTPFGLGR